MNLITRPVLFKTSILSLSVLTTSISFANQHILQTPSTHEEDAVTLGSVVVTGSRKNVKSALDAPAPVDVVSHSDLVETGETDLSKALAKLSPSATLPTSPGGGFSASIGAGIALRGLNSEQTLILINGKRRHTSAYFTRQTFAGARGSAGTDLSLIPISAVERVEILRDGAAAQFGSDAIAGVVNIILKSKDQGGGISYQTGGYTQGEGEQHKINAWKGIQLPNDGSLTLAIDLGKKDTVSITHPDTRVFYGPKVNPNSQYQENNTPYRTWNFGSPEVKDQINLSYNADLPLNDSTALYSFATYGHRKAFGENFYEPPSTSGVLNRSEFFKARYPDGRVPLSIVSVDDFALTLGIKTGEQKTGKLDSFVTYGRNKVHTDQGNGINPSYGPESSSSYSLGDNIFSQLNTGIDYSRNFLVSWLYSPLIFSTGALYRWEEYQQRAGNPIAYTRGPFFNPSPVAGVGIPAIYAGITDEDSRKIHRDVYGAYIDAEADLIKNLNLGLAVRSENYSDFGTTTNGKLSLKYDLNPKFSLRSSASTGYRAPSLTQLGYSTYSVQTVDIKGIWQDVQQRTLIAGSEAARLLGGGALKPEKSTNYSVGLVWQPLSQTSLTLDTYQIDIHNRISLSDNITGSIVSTTFQGTDYSTINNVAFFNNLIDTRTRGAELALKHDLDFEQYGTVKLNLGFAANNNEITKIRNPVTSKGQVIASSVIAGRNTRSLIESAAPSNKVTTGLLWNFGDWSVNTAVRRYGKWKILNNSDPALDQTFNEQWIADLDVGFQANRFVQGLKFNLGAVNLFNSFPDQTISSAPYGVVKYTLNSPEGTYGTYLYARASYDF